MEHTPDYLAGYKQALEDIASRANMLLNADRDAVVRLLKHTVTVNSTVVETGFTVAAGVPELSTSGLLLDGRRESPNPFGIVFVVEDGAGVDRDDWIPKIHHLEVIPLSLENERGV